jgi:RHS repeat-associated protein
MHFTGKQRDTETGLDDFGARYYSSLQGRWYSPDWASAQVPVPYADLSNPQTLNLYDYVGGDPTNHADADGHAVYAAGSGTQPGTKVEGEGCDVGADQATCAGAAKPQTPAQNTAGPSIAERNAATLLTPPEDGTPGASSGPAASGHGLFGIASASSRTVETVTDADGTVHTTITATTAIYLNGKFDSAATATSTDGYAPSVQTLNYGQAAKALGADNLGAARDASLPSGEYQFARAVASDAYHHPIKYAAHAAGLALPFLGLGPEIEGLITGVEALHTASDLNKEMQ